MQVTTNQPALNVETSPGPTLAYPGIAAATPACGDAGSLPAEKIANIMAMIDGIALRTRALAHVAAEAAHVGEPGLGFALMASEVKSLAQRSAAAVREIKGLVGESVHKAGKAEEARQREFEERARRWQRSLSA